MADALEVGDVGTVQQPLQLPLPLLVPAQVDAFAELVVELGYQLKGTAHFGSGCSGDSEFGVEVGSEYLPVELQRDREQLDVVLLVLSL